ncbi:MAG: protein kinase [Acidobacteriia bacterium]|nr:protein kinase [Terriglobia bacterium]
MGEVYRATDSKLGREVALKVLPAEMARDPERLARFQREARAVAALNHPHIVTIFSVEEAEGVHFLTMELVDGQSLDRLIPEDGLPVERIVEIAGALAGALAAAHEKGIVHRDLKPANVMVANDGRVKILDFGLAKDVSPDKHTGATMTSAGQTEVGVVMGTPAYMSPEQVSGRTLDPRTDIFSLGVVLHQMATGKQPFCGNSSAELISAILRDTPPPVTEVRPDLPSDLGRIIRRCLEKDPSHRVQTARDVANEFRDLARQTSQKISVSTSRVADSGAARAEQGFWVAVLPFKYSGANPDLTVLAEGLTADIVTGLSRFSYLRVIARGSTAKYSSESGDVRAIGKELGARYVMEGSLRQAGAKLRLAVQLVDATTGAHLWAENYERTFSPETVFELQDDLVPRIVSTIADMNGVLPRSMSEVLRSRPPEQLSPYEAVLRSFGYCERGTPEELTAARSGLEAAVRKAPNYADAWAMLAFLCGQDYVHAFNLQADALAIGAAAARRAVEAGPSNHLAYFSLAQVLAYQKEFHTFRDAAERAIALNPMDGNSVALLGELMTYAGERERGMELAGRAKQLNPNHPGWYWFADFYNAYRQGDDRAALSFALKVKLQGHPLAPMFIAAASGQLGEADTAAKAVRDLLKVRPDLPAIMRTQVEKVWDPEYGERFLDGLRKAGLEIPDTESAAPTPEISRSAAKADSGAARAEGGFWVAVLPFKYNGANADLAVLAEGLTEDIVTGLSRFSYLRVIARSSTLRYANQVSDLRTVGKGLGARYVMEGSLRLVGTTLRLAVQLVDTNSGAHLWAETYDRPFKPESVLELQDDLVPRIVSTVADQYGILPRTMSEVLRSKSEEQLTPHEAVLRTFSYFERITPDEHAIVRRILERAVKNAPDHSDCWAMLSMIYRGEYAQGFNTGPDPLGRAIAAAQRAVELAPSNALGYWALATSLFFHKDKLGFRAAAERAMALNRMDGSTIAFMGLLIAYAGDWDRGCKLVESAMQLNPNHPGWYHNALFSNAYNKGQYAEALDAALRINMPGYFANHAALAAALGQLGRREAAQKAVRDLLFLRPDFATAVRDEFAKWWEPELVEHFIDGLRKAGLETAEDSEKQAPAPTGTTSGARRATTGSGATRADEGFWVAVLPFKYNGTNAELTALAEGLTEDIVTGLSRFSYLRVIARGSTLRYAHESGDVRLAGKELGARYVMEGSLRQAGNRLRLAVQLVDTSSGAHLWAETYDRSFQSETVFELQDDLVPRIVSTVADTHGVLPYSMSQTLRGKNPDQLTPYEAFLRGFSYFKHVNEEEHASVRAGLERAVQQAPGNADCWALLAMLYREENNHGFNLRPDPVGRALAAARKAIDIAPSNHLAHHALASVLFFRKENQAFRSSAERAIALNPLDGFTMAYMGFLLAYSGDWDRGCELVEKARNLNPNHPGWYWFPPFFRAYRKGDYAGALEFALKVSMSGFWRNELALAATYGQLGELELARNAARDLLAVRPDFAAVARQECLKWWDPELVENLIEGLRKAGLEVGGENKTVDKTSQ